MGLMNRFLSLARADAHGALDALEDRALVLRQHLREAGAELDRKRAHLEALRLEDRDLASSAEQNAERRAALDADVELALAEDNEELARFAIKKLLPLRQQAALVERRRKDLATEREELEAALARQEEQQRDLEQRVRAFLARQKRAGGEAADADVFAAEPAAAEEVELELLRRKQAAEAGAA